MTQEIKVGSVVVSSTEVPAAWSWIWPFFWMQVTHAILQLLVISRASLAECL
jgi:hypothetical protein